MEEFIEKETGKGRVYEYAEEVMQLLAKRGLRAAQACAVLTMCLDYSVNQVEGEHADKFKRDTVDLVRQIILGTN